MLTVDEIFRSGTRLLTERVRIRGALRIWGMECHLSGCRPGDCCNDCKSWLAVGDDRRRVGDELVLLRGTPCYGDDSGVCCSVRVAGQDVIVEGILSTGLTGAREPGAQYAIAEPSICSVKDVRAHGAPHP